MTFPGDYEWKIDITAQATKVSSNETSFPYYFNLANITSANFWDNVQTDGGDLRVSTDSAGTTQVPLEVVAINDTAETGEIHFKDSTDSASNKTFYLWWSDSTGTVSQPGVATTYGRNAVWSVHETVYHLQESSGTVIDSAGNNNGTNSGATTEVTGQIENGYDLDGINDEIILGGIQLNSADNWTIEAWIEEDSGSDAGAIFSQRNAFTTMDFYLIHYQSSHTNHANKWELYLGESLGDGFTGTTFGSDNITNTKTKVTLNKSGNDYILYVNGSAKGTFTSSQGWSTSDTLKAGSMQSGFYFDGTYDEITITLSSLSSGWESTKYNMQSSNSTFWVEGTPEEITPSTFTITTNAATSITTTEATLNGTVTDFGG